MSKTDTHFYDGKLIYKDIKFSNATREQKILMFTKLLEHDKIKNNIHATKAINLIMGDIGKDANIDKTSNLIADDLLFALCELIKSKGILELIELELIELNVEDYMVEQLSDIITSGQCAQGRCARIYQLL
jgi:hypothetical protein